MPLPVDIALALRYLKPRRNFVSVITLLSVLGPLLGVAIMIIVSSVMAGFAHDINVGLMNMQAHLTVYPMSETGVFADPEALMAALEREGGLQGLKAAPVIEGTALVQVRDSVYPRLVRGIVPELDSKVSGLQAGFDHKGYVLKEGDVAVGKRMGMRLGLSVGAQMLVHSPARLTQNVKWKEDGQVEVTEPDEFYLPEECTIRTYYTIGISDYEDNLVIMHRDQAAELFGLDWGSATSIQAVVDDPMRIAELAAILRRLHPDCHFETWQEKNALLVATVQNERSMMNFLMTFIVLVAAFAIAATLITVVVQKTREIGILKAVGLSSWTVARVFLLQGTIIGLVGTALGAAAGLTILHYRTAIANLLSRLLGAEIFPAELYHLTEIPALTTPGDLTRIVALSLLLCVLAALVPAAYASAFSPAKALRSDA